MSLTKPIWSFSSTLRSQLPLMPEHMTWVQGVLNLKSIHFTGNREIVYLAGINADGGTDRWKQEELDEVKWAWRRDGSERGKVEDGWIGAEHHRDGVEGEGWRCATGDCWAVCLKINQRGSLVRRSVSINTNTRTSVRVCVCVCIHAWTHTHANTLQHKYTYYQFVHTLPIGEVVKGHGWLGAAGWLCPEWQSSACWDVWIQMQSSIKTWGRSPFFSVSLSSSFFELLTSSFFYLCCFSVLCYTRYTLSHKASYICISDLPVSLLINPSFIQLMWMNSSSQIFLLPPSFFLPGSINFNLSSITPIPLFILFKPFLPDMHPHIHMHMHKCTHTWSISPHACTVEC